MSVVRYALEPIGGCFPRFTQSQCSFLRYSASSFLCFQPTSEPQANSSLASSIGMNSGASAIRLLGFSPLAMSTVRSHRRNFSKNSSIGSGFSGVKHRFFAMVLRSTRCPRYTRLPCPLKSCSAKISNAAGVIPMTRQDQGRDPIRWVSIRVASLLSKWSLYFFIA